MTTNPLKLTHRFFFTPSRFLFCALLIWLAAGSVFFEQVFAQEQEPVGGLGMTWASWLYFEDLDVSYSRCYGQPASGNGTTACNAYTGDTSCTESLPILCVLIDDSPRPPYDPQPNVEGVMPKEFYRGWANGRIGSTAPVTGTLLTSLETANDLCAVQLGDGYRMAEHHDGLWISGMDAETYYEDTWPERNELNIGGWGFFSYGEVSDDTRYWVHINDQPANCWNSTPTALSTLDEPLTLNTAPQAPSSIAGRVIDEDGTPLANIEVGLIPNGRFEPERTITTTNDGTYQFNLLGAGLYQIVFVPEGSGNYLTEYYPGVDGLANAERISVASSDVEVEDVALTLGGAIAGTIQTTDGQAFSQVQISVSQNLSSTSTPVLKEVRTQDFPHAYIPYTTPVDVVSYEIKGLAAGLYRICVTGKAYRTYAPATDCYNQAGTDVEVAQDITVTQGITSTIDFQLTPETRYTISGTVTLPNGNPLSGIRVSSYNTHTNSVEWSGGPETKTDEAGRYELNGLRAGLYTLYFTDFDDPYVSKQYLGYRSDRTDAQIVAVGENAEPLTIDFVPRQRGVISGVVTSPSGQPLSGIRVGLAISTTRHTVTNHTPPAISFGRSRIYWESARTDENGRYEYLVESGYDFGPTALYSLVFANPSDQYMDEYLGNSLEIANAAHLNVSLGAQLTDVNFVAREGATVTGSVTMGGAPVESGVEIHMQMLVDGEWLEMTFDEVVDAAGTYQIQGLTPGSYKFAASAKLDGSDTRYFYGGQTDETAIVLEIGLDEQIQNIDIDFGPNLFDGVLAGRVIYQDEPVENIQVEIDRRKNGVHSPVITLLTDADGRFRVEGVLPGSYCIRYVDPNGVYATNNNDGDRRCDRVHLEAGGQRTDLDYILSLGGTIRGQITDLGGPLMAPVEVIAYVSFPYAGRANWSNIGLTTIADADGRYTLAGLPSQTYRIGARYQTDDDALAISTYYKGSQPVDEASNVRVSNGSEIANIDMFFGSIEDLAPRSFLPFVGQTVDVERTVAQTQDSVRERAVTAARSAPEAPSSIVGRVTDENGTPLPDVEVGLIPNDGARLTSITDNDGIYRFGSLGAGLYRIVFMPERSSNYPIQYYPGVDSLADAERIFVASNDVQVNDFALTLGGSIVGTIRTTDGQPMQKLRVVVYQNEGDSITPVLELLHIEDQPVITPSNTISYSIKGLTEGLYRLCATGEISGTARPMNDCYAESASDVELTQDISVTLGMTATFDFHVAPKAHYTISGTVRSPNGDPLFGIEVTAYISSTSSMMLRDVLRGRVRTDEAGRYQIEGLRAGLYTLRFSGFDSSYVDQYLGYRWDRMDAQYFTVGENAESSTIDFALRKQITISGVVTSPTGEPLPGIIVGRAISPTRQSTLVNGPVAAFIWQVNESRWGTRTNENGQYSLQIQNPTDLSQNYIYSLVFGTADDQYIDEYLGNSLTFTNATHIDLSPGDQLTGINFVAREGATATGVVTVDGVPIDSGFNVHAYTQFNGSWFKVSSDWVVDPAGNYQIQGLAPGLYKFSASKPINRIENENFYGGDTIEAAAEVEISIEEDGQNIDIDLGTGLFDGVLAGRVVYQSEPVEDIRIEIYNAIDNHRLLISELQTDADGRFRLEGVVQGSYCIRYSDPNGVYATSDYYSSELIRLFRCGRIGLYAGEQRTDLDHSLTLGGTISGQITNLDGPLTNPVEVVAFSNQGTWEGVWADGIGLKTIADADGRYTLSGLPEGTYRVGARYLLNDNTPDTSVFYGLSNAVDDANDVRVASGEQVASINMLFGSLEQLEPRSFLPFITHTD